MGCWECASARCYVLRAATATVRVVWVVFFFLIFAYKCLCGMIAHNK